MRILITGSRSWTNRPKMVQAFYDAIHGRSALELDMETVVVHGGVSGADVMAADVARELNLGVEVHLADWRPGGVYDRTAGHKRNQKMVDLGADIMLVFVMPCEKPDCKRGGTHDGHKAHDSHGTAHCMKIAKSAGIEVTVIRP